MIKFNNDIIKLDTPHTSLILKICERYVEQLYYGKRIKDADNYECLGVRKEYENRPSVDDTVTAKTTISFAGQGNSREEFVRLVHDDTSFDNRFVYDNYRIFDGAPSLENLPAAHGTGRTLEITYKDVAFGTLLKQYYTVFDDADGVVCSSAVINVAETLLRVKRLMSVQLDIEGTGYEILSLMGAYGFERQESRNRLDFGVYNASSTFGCSSSKCNPFVQVKKEKDCYGVNLIYSGNHNEIVEAVAYGRTRILCGMNDYMFEWNLQKGETLQTPQAIMIYAETEAELSHRMHTFVAKHIIPARFAQKERPIVINSWEACYFDFDRAKLEQMADTAKRVGIEMFVLDDGWFGKRNDDKTSLGDWFDNVEKTGGVESLVKSIRDKGLQFGIWVEPEMISKESALYEKHPEYALVNPHFTPIEKRFQLLLDLANKEVQDYIIDSMSRVFSSLNVDYVKWDYNRIFTDVYSKHVQNMGEYYHRYMLGLYRILRVVTERFPAILFESCSAGGNRFDLGMMCFMPQTWASDDTDARDRLLIQQGTLRAYPQSCMTAHVSQCTLNHTSLESRFNVASAGVLGYEMDISVCSEEELSVITKQIEFYKKHRKLLQFGHYYCLKYGAANESTAWIVVNDEQSEAIVTVAEKCYDRFDAYKKYGFGYLNDDYKYRVSSREQNNVQSVSFEAYGDVLNGNKLDLGDLFEETDREQNSNSIATRMFYVEKI